MRTNTRNASSTQAQKAILDDGQADAAAFVTAVMADRGLIAIDHGRVRLLAGRAGQ